MPISSGALGPAGPKGPPKSPAKNAGGVWSSQERPPVEGPRNPAWDPPANPAFPDTMPPGSGALGPAGPVGPPQLQTSLVPGATGHAVLGSNPDQRLPQKQSTETNPALINPNNQYVDAFNASMATQRQAIDNALAASLVQLGARRDAAGKVVAGIPQQIKDTYAQTDTKMSGIMQAAGADNTGVGGDANAALYANDNQAAQQAGQSVQPLLQLGVQANYDRGEAGLNQAHLEGLSGLNAQQAQFDAQMAAGEQQRNYAIEDRNYEIQHPGQLTGLTAAQRADINYRNRQFDASQAQNKTEMEYKQNADAQSQGYTSYQDQLNAEQQAATYSHENGQLKYNDIKTLDVNLVNALFRRGLISEKDLKKYKGA